MKFNRLIFGLGFTVAIAVLIQGLSQPMPVAVSSLEGRAEVFAKKKRVWNLLKPGYLIKSEERFRAGMNGTLQIRPSSNMLIAFGNRALASIVSPRYIDADKAFNVWLSEGSLLVSLVPGSGRIHCRLANSELDSQDGTFKIVSDHRNSKDSICVLEGEVLVRRRDNPDSAEIRVGPLQKIEIFPDLVSGINSMTQDDWVQAYAAYALYPLELGFQSHQRRLSREAGSLFHMISERGDFYTPKESYFRGQFVKDPEGGESVLKLYYDVFSPDAFAGIYLITPKFYFKNYSGIEFDIKSEIDSSPAFAYLEFKSLNEVIYSHVIKHPLRKWGRQRVDFPAGINRRVDEVILYVTYGSAGPVKRGTFFIRNVNLIAKAGDDAAA